MAIDDKFKDGLASFEPPKSPLEKRDYLGSISPYVQSALKFTFTGAGLTLGCYLTYKNLDNNHQLPAVFAYLVATCTTTLIGNLVGENICSRVFREQTTDF